MDPDPSYEAASFEVIAPADETELLDYFEMQDGTHCNAFYTWKK